MSGRGEEAEVSVSLPPDPPPRDPRDNPAVSHGMNAAYRQGYEAGKQTAEAQRDRIREAGDELAAAIEMPWESLHEREQRLKRLDAALVAWRVASQDSPDA